MTKKPQTTVWVTFGDAALADPNAKTLHPPPFIFAQGGRETMSREDKAIEVLYDGQARRVVDRLIRRGELKKTAAPTPKEK